MPICQIDQCFALVKLSLNADEIAPLLQRHPNNDTNIEELEAFGAELARGKFPEAASCEFVKNVCVWGAGHRNVKRVLELNEPADIAKALRDGHRCALNGKVPGGVSRIATLKYLGISYASKQLRVLLPDHAVILDSVIRTRLGYAESEKGYAEFLSDCHQLLNRIQAHPRAGATALPVLRVCDIEAAIFQKLQETV